MIFFFIIYILKTFLFFIFWIIQIFIPGILRHSFLLILINVDLIIPPFFFYVGIFAFSAVCLLYIFYYALCMFATKKNKGE